MATRGQRAERLLRLADVPGSASRPGNMPLTVSFASASSDSSRTGSASGIASPADSPAASSFAMSWSIVSASRVTCPCRISPSLRLLVELLLELPEPPELLLELGVRDLGPARELTLDVEELLGRFEDPLLLVPVEGLEPVLGREVRLEDRREDVRVVVGRPEPVLHGSEAVEDLLLGEVLETLARRRCPCG